MASSYDVQKVTINDHTFHTWRVKLKFFILEKCFGDQDKKINYVYEIMKIDSKVIDGIGNLAQKIFKKKTKMAHGNILFKVKYPNYFIM